jgi:hypothetical protein
MGGTATAGGAGRTGRGWAPAIVLPATANNTVAAAIQAARLSTILDAITLLIFVPRRFSVDSIR